MVIEFYKKVKKFYVNVVQMYRSNTLMAYFLANFKFVETFKKEPDLEEEIQKIKNLKASTKEKKEKLK